MAKGYSFVDIQQPTGCSASAVSGGSLVANTTYYYRILKVSKTAQTSYFYGKSMISDQFSVTTDTINKTARITFNCPLEAGTSYRIYRSTSPTDIGTTYLNHLRFYPKEDVYNIAGVVTFDDDGTYVTQGNNFAEIDDKAHGILTLSGSTSSDPFSIVDLYEADQANGWGVIQKLNINTYKVNCYLIMHTNGTWKDVNKTIILADGADLYKSGSYFYFGEILGESTKNGCEIIVTSSWLTQLSFFKLTAYRTIFKYVYPFYMLGLGLVTSQFSLGLIQDCQIDKIRGFLPGNTCLLKNCIFSQFDNLFGNSTATFEDVKCLNGSRVRQIAGSNQNVVARGLYTGGASVIFIVNSNATSSLTTIDSVVSPSIIFAGDNTGFIRYDQFSYNFTALDLDGNGIEGVNLKIYSSCGLVVDENSDINGVVPEQLITRKFREASGTTLLPFVDCNPFHIVVSKEGYETYNGIVTYDESNPIIKTVTLKAEVPIRDADGEKFIALNPALGSSSHMTKI